MDNTEATEVVQISGGPDQLDTIHIHLQSGEVISLVFAVPVTDSMYHCFEQLARVTRAPAGPSGDAKAKTQSDRPTA